MYDVVDRPYLPISNTFIFNNIPCNTVDACTVIVECKWYPPNDKGSVGLAGVQITATNIIHFLDIIQYEGKPED